MPARITVEKSGARKVNLKMLLESKAAQNQLKQIAKMQTKQFSGIEQNTKRP